MTTTDRETTNPQPHSAQTAPAEMACPADRPLEQGVDYIRRCMREHPETTALCCFGVGFVLGWKLKPW